MSSSTNRVAAHIESVRAKIAAVTDEASLKDLEATMAVEPSEHFAYQEAQARAHAMGKLSTEEAQIVYNALGESYGTSNGGWTEGTDLATKVSVTLLVKELVIG